MVAQAKAGGKPGSIVNLSSVNAVFALPDHVAYSISKGGISQLTKVMALSLAKYNIRVNAIGPGSINTAMLRQVMANDDIRRRILSRTVLTPAEKAAGLDAGEMSAIWRAAGSEFVDYYVPDSNGVIYRPA